MPEHFTYDVFLSYSSKDWGIIQPLAERLRADGIRVWLDSWEIKPGDSIPAKIDQGLEQSRLLLFCMSKNVFSTDWPRFESNTFRFRDPLNNDRRFIPLRLDDAPIKSSLAQFFYVDWRKGRRNNEEEYEKLVRTLRSPTSRASKDRQIAKRTEAKVLSFGHTRSIRSVIFDKSGNKAISASEDNTLRLWDTNTGTCLRVFEGHIDGIRSVALTADGRRALSGSGDRTLRLWDVESGTCLRVFEGHTNGIRGVALTADGRRALSGSDDKTVRLWDVDSGDCTLVWKGHTDSVLSVALSPDGKRVLSGSWDNTLRLWSTASESHLQMMVGHRGSVWSVAFSPDENCAISGSDDRTLRLWDTIVGEHRFTFDGHTDCVEATALSSDGHSILSSSDDHTLRLWDIESGSCLRAFKGHASVIRNAVLADDGRHALSGSDDCTLRLWDVQSGRCLRTFNGHTDAVFGVSLNAAGNRALSGSWDSTLRLWDTESGRCLHVLEGHAGGVRSVALSSDGRRAISGSNDQTLRLWDMESGTCLLTLGGHNGDVKSVALSADGRHALSGSSDKTLRLWDVDLGTCLRVFEGHTGDVRSVVFSADGHLALSGSYDATSRLWDIEAGKCIYIFKGHTDRVISVVLSDVCQRVLTSTTNCVARYWDLRDILSFDTRKRERSFLDHTKSESNFVRYTNAKVLLVGESGVGKTALSNRLVFDKFVPTAATDGVWATHWPLPVDAKDGNSNREIWLWDFAGQVDYRLIQQLFMNDTAAAVLVFNPQNENPFENLGHWDADLQKASSRRLVKLLVASRKDRGGLIVNDASISQFIEEHGYEKPLHLTSAKTGEGCKELRDALVSAIDWQSIPETTSPNLYQHLKTEILRLRDKNVVTIRLAELKQRMEMALCDEVVEIEELDTVVTLLDGPGIIKRLDCGGNVLLRPEVLGRYAAAVVRTVRQHPKELGCIREDDLLAGKLDFADFQRLPPDDEAVLLPALIESFVSRAWCLRQPCDGSKLLTFPSYFRREAKERPRHPNVLVTYRFEGLADEVYATLVVRLHYTAAFEITGLWRAAADFRTLTGLALGITLTQESEGTSRLEVYFTPEVDEDSRALFLRYIHDHLNERAKNVVRLRYYICKNVKCKSFQQPLMVDRAAIDRALELGGTGKIFCPACGKVVNLRDVVEKKFNSQRVKEGVRKEQQNVQRAIDNESRELLAVHHVGYIVAEAGQIFREYANSDQGIDCEIEFKDDDNRATGRRLYLQIKSGDSYLRERERDGAEIFQIKKRRWAEYWQQHAYPVMLVIRTSDGNIRWMDVSEYLRHESAGRRKPPGSIVFSGERLTAASLRRWRDNLLEGHPRSR